jgi:hypothetical protein
MRTSAHRSSATHLICARECSVRCRLTTGAPSRSLRYYLDQSNLLTFSYLEVINIYSPPQYLLCAIKVLNTTVADKITGTALQASLSLPLVGSSVAFSGDGSTLVAGGPTFGTTDIGSAQAFGNPNDATNLDWSRLDNRIAADNDKLATTLVRALQIAVSLPNDLISLCPTISLACALLLNHEEKE